MSYDGSQRDCTTCGWANFAIRSRCRNCGHTIGERRETTAEARTVIGAGDYPAKAPKDDPAFRRIIYLPTEWGGRDSFERG